MQVRLLESDATVAAVVVAGVRVALLVAAVVALLLAATVLDALPLVLGPAPDVADAVGRSVDPSRRRLVRDLAVLAAPSGVARAVVVPDPVDAAAVLAGVVSALVPKTIKNETLLDV